MSSMIKTEQDIKEAALALSNILVRELKEKPFAMRFLGKPEMVELASKPGELRFEPRKAAEFYLSLAHVKLPVRITLKLAGLNSFKKGLGPLREALAGNEQFVEIVAVVYGVDPISRKELEDELYEYLGEHGEDFLVELAKEKGREALIDGRHGLVWFALNAWFGSKAASALPDLGLVPSEVSQVLEDWMIDRGYPAVAR